MGSSLKYTPGDVPLPSVPEIRQVSIKVIGHFSHIRIQKCKSVSLKWYILFVKQCGGMKNYSRYYTPNKHIWIKLLLQISIKN